MSSSPSLAEWIQELARQYYAGRTSVFILYGNIHDYIWYEGHPYPPREFYTNILFRRRELVFTFNPATGLVARDPEAQLDLTRTISAVPSRNPTDLFPLLHIYFQQRLREGRRIGFIIEHAELLMPSTSTYAIATSSAEKAVLLHVLQWAQSQTFLQGDVTILVLTESLSELHPKLTGNPHLSAIRVPYPDFTLRRAFIQKTIEDAQSAQPSDASTLPAALSSPSLHPNLPGISLESLSAMLGGLTLVQIEKLLAEVAKSKDAWTEARLLERKKELIQAHAGGLVEFMPTHLTLDAVAGHRAAREYLRSIAQVLKAGHYSALPMGFLITGAVGTGKTFLVRCFAGEIGIPMVQLRNFRSKWHGETEANLEKIFALLEALAPVAVFVDEADTQLGTREGAGDSGVSARVFGRLASFMSDPRHRGRIIWFLATARPDLLPVDLKRQGRAEEHIPLFPPTTPEEKKEVVTTIARRLGLGELRFPSDEEFWERLAPFTGAEWEAILTRTRFRALLENRLSPQWEDVEAVLADFLPPNYPEQMEYMTYLAILECTRRNLLPPTYQQMSREEILERIRQLRMRR